MAKYPDNPFWNDERDVPVLITSQHDWDEAVAGGYLTAEHVQLRLELMLEFEFGNGADLGFNEEGFLNALTSAGTRFEGGLKISIYPEDHDPPHAHIEFRSDPKHEFRLDLDTGELLRGDTIPPGGAKKLKRAKAVLAEHGPTFKAQWASMRPG